MGLGKTIVALEYVERHPDQWPVLVICPAYLKWNWEKAASDLFSMPAEILSGYGPPKGHLTRRPRLVIINYEILADRRVHKADYRGWRFWLRNELKPAVVIVDEIQNVRTRGAKRTKATKLICKSIPCVIALGGTAGLEKSPADLYPALNMVWPEKFNHFEDYAFRYCGPKKEFGKWQFKGASNLEELHRLLIPKYLLRRRMEDVLPDIPKKRRIVTLLDIEHREQYEKAEADLIGWLRQEYADGRADRADKAAELSKYEHLRQLVVRLKRTALIRWIEDFLEKSDKKLIFFGYHVAFLEGLHRQYSHNSLLVTGSVAGRKRHNTFEQFQRDKSKRILFGNIKAAGSGWSAKGRIVNAHGELAWNPSEHNQADGRARGIERGEKGMESVSYYLLAAGTIEEMIARGLQRKQRHISHILDGKGGGERLDVYDMVRKELMKKGKT